MSGPTDPLAEARARVAGRSGGFLSVAEAATLLGISGLEVIAAASRREILSVESGSDICLSSCQFKGRERLPGLSSVLHAFAGRDPWLALDFLSAPDAALSGRTPAEALADGDQGAVERLLRACRGDGFT